MRLDLVTLVVGDLDAAIAFFVDLLDFRLEEDVPAATTGGRPKRWVVVRPRDGGAGLVLARADGAEQEAVVGRQVAGRVGFFLRVEEVDRLVDDLAREGVVVVRSPRTEPYGRVAVIEDVAGNRWDLVEPPAPAPGDARGLAEALRGVLVPRAPLGVVGGVQVVVTTVELWSASVVVRLAGVPSARTAALDLEHAAAFEAAAAAARAGGEARFPRQPSELLTRERIELQDDRGAAFAWRGSAAGGTGSAWRAEVRFAPGAAQDARTLTLRLGSAPRVVLDLADAA